MVSTIKYCLLYYLQDIDYRFDTEAPSATVICGVNLRFEIDLKFFSRRFDTFHHEAVTEFRLTNRAYRHAIT